MKIPVKLLLALLVCSIALQACSQQKESKVSDTNVARQSSLAAKIRQYSPTDISADALSLSEGDRKALDKLIEAAKLMDPIFLRQVWSGNVALKQKLESLTSEEDREKYHFFMINKGPWDRQDKNLPFIDGVPHEKPLEAGFYPDGIAKEEFNKWIETLTPQEKEKATGYFYTIRRGPDGKLKTVPYSEEYREFLEPAAKLLREAADLTTNQTLKTFLTKRADAFSSNDYYASDVAWMELDAPIDLTFGPYETYEDELF